MTRFEVERKRELAGGSDTVTARLAELGYRQRGTNVEVDTYYSRPDRDFLVTIECLRVRERDGFAEITYKPASTADTHSAVDIIAKPETTVILSGSDEAAAAKTLLDALGMVPLCRVEKKRTTFGHPTDTAITVAIDFVTGVGEFVETEVMATDADQAAALLIQVERQLGVADRSVVKLPYRDLVLRHHHGDRDARAAPQPGRSRANGNDSDGRAASRRVP
jgi:adenylate cyclase, class 2